MRLRFYYPPGPGTSTHPDLADSTPGVEIGADDHNQAKANIDPESHSDRTTPIGPEESQGSGKPPKRAVCAPARGKRDDQGPATAAWVLFMLI
jgi:hypothetical protein